ncbi:diaminopimelate epimerase [Gallionella capsiferriformans]|uniref:Diaminopimelate epimerase n=1 Tax=Gallionella capsiferriformans (strain ES-2) TaxID=395494 RepID=D9SD84_GALCS|nr:diaminopimelate epimerase [Gallionella capsiferriformans]ADL56682.1 diaminopimelate epimerase [Gallionella capsiferriformans ES-2]
MRLKFTKMHGAGNDFVVLDGVRQQISLTTEQLRLLADRHFGVGCDQILLVEKAHDASADFRYRIFNADGGEVEQCGNGARCFVRFVHDQKLTNKAEIVVETHNGLIRPRLEADGRVVVNMGAPVFDAARIPFSGGTIEVMQPLVVADQTLMVSIVSMGNPHAVQVVDDVERAAVEVLGPLIEHHASFPKRVNAGFMQIMDRQHIRLRVYERGSGETLSCGTGACAAVVSGIRRGLLDSPVSVATHGGNLSIAWGGEETPVLMTGPAISVFSGEINL